MQGSADQGGQATVTGTAPCASCGYDLKGLSTACMCPECRRSVAGSQSVPLLVDADAEYLTCVHLGLTLVRRAFIVQLMAAGVWAAVVFAILPLLDASIRTTPAVLDLVTASGYLMLAGMSAVGCWMMTRVDRGCAAAQQPARSRRHVRVWSVLAVIAGCVDVTVAALVGLGVMSPAELRLAWPATLLAPGGAIGTASIVGLATTTIALLAWGVQLVGTMRYGAWLARRVPDMALVGEFKRGLWAMPITGVWAPGEANVLLFLVPFARYVIVLGTLRGLLGELAESAQWRAANRPTP